MENLCNVASLFAQLSIQEQKELLGKLTQQMSQNRPILNHCAISQACPRCESDKITKHGSYMNGGSRFMCKDCKRTFNELTGTALHYIIKKDRWVEFIELSLQSKSIRYIAKEMGISTKTVLVWRHKMLAAFNTIFQKEFKGIVETDDVYFKFDQRGRNKPTYDYVSVDSTQRGLSTQQVSVMFSVDRYKTVDMKIMRRGKINKKQLFKVINTNRFNENIICSDNCRVIKSFVKDLGMPHEILNMSNKEYVRGAYHINTLNNVVSRFKTWIKLNFKGVSTKHLQLYLNWFKMLQIINNDFDKYINLMLRTPKAITMYRNSENNYQELLAA